MSEAQSLVLQHLTEIQQVTNTYLNSMANPNLQKEERYTLRENWVGMTNHLDNARRAEVLGARSDASFLEVERRVLLIYVS